MVYEGSQSLQYVKNFVKGADQWEGKVKKYTLAKVQNATFEVGIKNGKCEIKYSTHKKNKYLFR